MTIRPSWHTSRDATPVSGYGKIAMHARGVVQIERGARDGLAARRRGARYDRLEIEREGREHAGLVRVDASPRFAPAATMPQAWRGSFLILPADHDVSTGGLVER
jgi:hypothetical protein